MNVDMNALVGLVELPALARLRRLASEIPSDQAIVEIGSYAGQSACWLAAGTTEGHHAPVTCIDPWEHSWEGALEMPVALDTFRDVVHRGGWDKVVTPLRTTSVEAARIWLKPVGLIFIDADHNYEPVKADVAAWLPHLAPGAWLTMHDYVDWPGVHRVIEEEIVPTGRFTDIEVVEHTQMWVGRLAE